MRRNDQEQAALPPTDLYHYEFIFDPHSDKQMPMEASAPKVLYKNWKAAREAIFDNDRGRMRLFETDTMVAARLS
jgi:hypothetical protein